MSVTVYFAGSNRISPVDCRLFASDLLFPGALDLGPLFFAIFIDDLCGEIQNSDFIMYADDVKIFKVIGSVTDAHLLEEDLQRVERWCKVNAMSLNTGKCEVITFSRRQQSNVVIHDYRICGSHLRRVAQVKDLGVLLDSRMTFKPHVDQIIG